MPVAVTAADKGMLPGPLEELKVTAFWGLLTGQSVIAAPLGVTHQVRVILYIAILSLSRSGRCSYLQYSSMILYM